MFMRRAMAGLVLSCFSTAAMADHNNKFNIINNSAKLVRASITNQNKHNDNIGPGVWATLETLPFSVPVFGSSKGYYGLKVERSDGSMLCEAVVTAESSRVFPTDKVESTCLLDGGTGGSSSDCALTMAAESSGACGFTIIVHQQ